MSNQDLEKAIQRAKQPEHEKQREKAKQELRAELEKVTAETKTDGAEPEAKTDAKAPAPRPHQRPPFDFGELPSGIPVATMRFTTKSMQVPGRQSDDHLNSETLPNGRAWLIEWIPQIRHFKVTYIDPQKQKGGPSVIAFVHETHVQSWAPWLG